MAGAVAAFGWTQLCNWLNTLDFLPENKKEFQQQLWYKTGANGA